MRTKHYTLKLAIAYVVSFGLRLLPLRPANVEPIMATFLPFSHRVNGLVNALLTSASMVLYDALTFGIGSWTWTTAITYGAIAWAASLYFGRITPNRIHYVGFSLVATLLFDLITGPIAISLLTGSKFWLVTMAQVPFTISHLVSNALLAAIVVPWLAKVLVDNPALAIQVPATQPVHEAAR
jgi:hypothetical protein